MFTVLIAEKEHIDAIKEKNKLFFEPFLENKELAFCCWNPEGQCLDDAVPGLRDTVGRQKKWRAVIINNEDAKFIKKQNPFDVVDYSKLTQLTEPPRTPVKRKEEAGDKEAGEEAPKETDEEKIKKAREAYLKWENAWKDYFAAVTKEKEAIFRSALEQPLQKLSTWLCFRPEGYLLNDVREKQDVHDWALQELAREGQDSGVVLERMERDQFKVELRLKETIRREFVAGEILNIANPTEVHCISVRTAENVFFDPDDFWSVHRDSEYSAFADRNMYFDKMRFMVFDLYPRTHRDFRTDYIRFLATVLVFVTNPMPTSVMQARRLYQLNAETDETPLCTMVTSYDRKLAETADVIDSQMEKIRSEIPDVLTDKTAEEMFCASKEVEVQLDKSCRTDQVLVSEEYGFFFDSPENEYDKWNSDYKASQKELSFVVKQQGRAVRKYASSVQTSGEVSDVNINRLTPHQIEDVRDYTDNEEDEMIAAIPPDLSDSSAYAQRLEKESQEVLEKINQRMKRKTTLILGGVCLGLFLLCFLPFLFSNNGTFRTVLTALGLSGAMLLSLLVVMAVTVFCLRMSITNAVRKYNDSARDIMGDIEAGMKRVSRYLSTFGNVRRGHAIQNYAKNNLDQYTKGLRIRMKHKEDIRRMRAYLKEDYADYFGDQSYVDEVMARPYAYDFNLRREYDYPAPFLAGDCRQIEFMGGGNFVTVPSSYITKITVEMEGLYEK